MKCPGAYQAVKNFIKNFRKDMVLNHLNNI